MQVTPHADHAALFAIDGGRRPIRSAGEQFAIGDDDAVARETLIDRAFHEPWAFSANVLLRPIVQDTLFPTIAYVAGPNELAYLAQLRGVYVRRAHAAHGGPGDRYVGRFGGAAVRDAP
jgi:uncharacterized protein YllA (UPF0747 family)